MLSDRGDVEVIYLKDEEFLPCDVEIRLGTLVRFVNVHSHDSFEGSNQSPITAHKVVIECKGLFLFSLDSTPSSPSWKHRHSKDYSNEASFTFMMSGKYQLTSPTFPKMKCIITVIEMETMPPQKVLYFPTAKDREKEAMISNKLTLTHSKRESALLNSSDCDGSGNTSEFIGHDGHDSEWSSVRKSRPLEVDGDVIEGSTPRRKAPSTVTHIAAKDRGGDDYCDGENSDDEVDNILKERHYFKSLKRNYVNVKSPVDWNKRLSPKSPPSKSTSKSPSKSPVMQTPRRPSHTSPQHQIITVDIEDYAFSKSFVEVKANQRIQFRLSKDVPLHAEHLLFGESGNKALRFEAPLLQQLEETSFTFTPQSGGEVKVSCKIYPEMVCTILVHADTDLNSPRPSSAVEVELRLGKSVTKSSTLQLSLEQLHQRAGGGEWSESQSSFLDSDDMFSCSDSPEKVARRARSGWAKLPTPSTPALASSTMATSAQSTASKDNAQLSEKKSAQDKDDHLFLRAYRRKFFTSDDDSRNNSDSSGMISRRREDYRSNNKSRMKLNFRSDNLHQSADALDGSDDSDSSDSSGTLYHNALTPNKKKRIDLTRKIPQSLHHRNGLQDKQSLRQNSGYENIRYSNNSKKGIDNTPQRHILVIEEFAFKPNNLTISSGDIVEFCKANMEVSNVSMSCEGEFDSLVVDNAALLPSCESKVSHTFCSVGVYTITNEVYNFMQCKVIVNSNKNYAPGNNQQDPAVSKPNEVLAQSIAPRLIGSFININKNSSPRTSPLSKPISNELTLDNKSPNSVVVVPSRGQGIPTVAPLFGSFSNLDSSKVTRELCSVAADDAPSIDDNGDDSDGKVTDTDENINSSNLNTNNLITLSHKEKKKLKSKLKKKLKKKKNKENNANLDCRDDNTLTKESNEYLPLANIVSDVNEDVNIVGATVVLSPECLPLATRVPSTRARDQDYFYMMLAASADLVAECDGDSENENCDHELILNTEKAPTSYYPDPEPIDHPSNLSIQVVNATVKPEDTFITETSPTVDKCMDIFTALPLALNNSGLQSVDAVDSVEAEVDLSTSCAPGALKLEVDHSQQNAKKKKKKKKSKKKKTQGMELNAEGELLLVTANDVDDNDDEDGNDEGDKAVEPIVNLECEVVQTRFDPPMEANEEIKSLQDAYSELLAEAESQLLISSDIDIATKATPLVEEKELSFEEKNLDDRSGDDMLGKVETSTSLVASMQSDQIQEVWHREVVPMSFSLPSQKSHSPPPLLPPPPVTPPPSVLAHDKGYVPLTVDKMSTQLLRNALFSPATSMKPPSTTVANAEERLISNTVDSDTPNQKKDLPLQLQNDDTADQPEEKGLTVEELTNSLHELEDFFYTRWACFQSKLDMASTDEQVVYLTGPKTEVDNYHTYTKKTYSSGRKRSKKR